MLVLIRGYFAIHNVGQLGFSGCSALGYSLLGGPKRRSKVKLHRLKKASQSQPTQMMVLVVNGT